jgi:hypothetical protein
VIALALLLRGSAEGVLFL